jgi:hypothetical protein
VAVRISASWEEFLPKGGMVTFRDQESGKKITAPTNSNPFRRAWQERGADRKAAFRQFCARSGVSLLELSTEDNAYTELRHFFRKRSHT